MMTPMEQNEWKVQADNTLVVGGEGEEEEQIQERKNWKGIFISLGIIVTVLLLIIVATLIIGPMQAPPFKGRRVVLSDLNNAHLVAQPMPLQWLQDGKLAYMSEDDGILLIDPKTNETTNFVNKVVVHQTEATEFMVSPNKKYVLLIHDIIQGRLYRRKAKYSIYDVVTDHYVPLKLWHSEAGHPRYESAQWTPPDEGLVIVDDGDLYYLSHPFDSPRVLTRDAVTNELYHGVPDILYEEILEESEAVWIPQSGNFIAAATFNDTNVRELPILEYSNQIYPKVQALRYATVNTPIPEVSLFVYDIKSNEIPPSRVKIQPPSPITEEHYLVDAGWANGTSLWCSWISRNHETSVLALCSHPTWKCKVIHENHVPGGASPTVKNPIWKDSWIAFPWSVKTFDGAWHKELLLISSEKGQHAPLSTQYYHFYEILACDTKALRIYFLGSDERLEYEEKEIYSVSLIKDEVICISCHIECKEISPYLNKDLSYAVINCQEKGLPSLYLLPLNVSNGVANVLHSQSALRKHFDEIALPITLKKNIKLSPILHAVFTLTLPPGFSALDETVLLPIVIQLIGPWEPINEGESNWRLGWAEYLSSGHQVAHATLEILGYNPSTRESINTMAQYHMHAIRKLLDASHFLDDKNVALYGWGSGGSLVLNAAAITPNMFSCIASINPITDWKAHGIYWSERLMGSEETFGSGRRYEESDLTRLVPRLKSQNILLVQGTRDPTAHHAFILAQSLSEGGVHFKHVLYADAMYSLRDVRKHLLEEFQDFFLEPVCIKTKFSTERTSEDI